MLQLDLATTKARQQQLLQEAKVERLYQQIKGHKASWVQRIKEVLTVIGSQIKIQAPANMVISASRTK